MSSAVTARSASRARSPSLSTLWNSTRRRNRRCFESPIFVHIRVPLARRCLSKPDNSNGKALATSSASAGQDRAAATGRHPSSEAVNAGASALLGLIRSLRHGVLVASIDCITTLTTVSSGRGVPKLWQAIGGAGSARNSCGFAPNGHDASSVCADTRTSIGTRRNGSDEVTLHSARTRS